MTLFNLIILTVMGAGVWWLTGFDRGYDGQSTKDQYIPRIFRTLGAWSCMLVLLGGGEPRGLSRYLS